VSAPTGERIADALVVHRDKLVTGGFGLLALMWSGMRLFDTLERALTTIWTGHEHRSFLKRELVGLLTMWAAGIVVLVSVGASLLLAFIRRSSPLRELLSGASWLFLSRTLSAASSFAIVLAACFFLYWLVPKANVPWKVALVGAIPAAIMWEVLRQGFSTFVYLYSRRWEVYGGLASAVLLTFWLYCSATVILMSAVIARVYQERTAQKVPPAMPSENLERE
jgi:membrane protein